MPQESIPPEEINKENQESTKEENRGSSKTNYFSAFRYTKEQVLTNLVIVIDLLKATAKMFSTSKFDLDFLLSKKILPGSTLKPMSVQ